jgi:hypothetical protein
VVQCAAIYNGRRVATDTASIEKLRFVDAMVSFSSAVRSGLIWR